MARGLVLHTLIVAILIKVTLQSLQDDIAFRLNATEKTLSRKRRYLVFPEGSSLQLVFCLTMPSIGMGQIFTVGSTAALAWELPHDPFVPFKKPADVLHRIDEGPVNRTSDYRSTRPHSKSESPAYVSYTKTHYDPFLFNKMPLTSSSSYSTINSFSQPSAPLKSAMLYQPAARVKSNNYYGSGKPIYNKNRNQIGQQQRKIEQTSKFQKQPITTYLHPVYHQIYRRTRRDLYSKIEKLFTALSRNGRACLLKSICEVSKTTKERGTFMEEIIKAIFRVRHHEDNGKEEKDMYDEASNQDHNCLEMYPECEESIWNTMFSQ